MTRTTFGGDGSSAESGETKTKSRPTARANERGGQGESFDTGDTLIKSREGSIRMETGSTVVSGSDTRKETGGRKKEALIGGACSAVRGRKRYGLGRWGRKRETRPERKRDGPREKRIRPKRKTEKRKDFLNFRK